MRTARQIHQQARTPGGIHQLSNDELDVYYTTCSKCYGEIDGNGECPCSCQPVQYYIEPFTGTLADSCYGRRVYIHRADLRRDETEPVVAVLNEVCPWSGSDKNHDGWLGWEMPITGHHEAIAKVEAVMHEHGFEPLSSCPWR
jgi:hypothetical protein